MLDTAKGGVPRKRARVCQSGRGAPKMWFGCLALTPTAQPGYASAFAGVSTLVGPLVIVLLPLWTLTNGVGEAGSYCLLSRG